MTFDRPLALLLLLAVPLLWWLHRRMRGPLEVVVASVLPFIAAADPDAHVARRRPLDIELFCLLGATVALSAAAAGVVFGGAEPRIAVVMDESASMLALRESGRTGLGEALARVERAAGDTELLRLWLVTPEPRPDPTDRRLPRLVPDGLPQSAAERLELAQGLGARRIVLLTDREMESTPDILVVGPGTPPAKSARIASVVLADDETIAVLLDWGDLGAAEVELSYAEEDAEPATVRRAAAGTPRVDFPAPTRGDFEVTARWFAGSGTELVPGDRNAQLVTARRTGRIAAVFVGAADGGESPRLAAAFDALGVRLTNRGEADAVVYVGGHYGTSDGPPAPDLWLAQEWGAPERVPAEEISFRGVLSSVSPRDGTVLISRARIGAETPEETREETADQRRVVARDSRGVLARTGEFTESSLDPEHAESTWHTDPSFLVFVGSVLDHIAGARDGLVILRAVPEGEGAGPARASELAAEDLAALAFVPEDGPRFPLGRLLAGLGAALALAASLVASRRVFGARLSPRAG